MKTLLCWLFCHRFFANMPEDEPGEWVAVAIVYSPFHSREFSTKHVTGLRNAYKTARWLALMADQCFPQNSEIGIKWAVRKAA